MKNWTLFAIVVLLFACRQAPKETADSTSMLQEDTQHSCCAPEVMDTAWYTSGKPAPLFAGLDGVHFKISTNSEQAQQYFNQGLMLSFGFNHAEAARSFYEAIRRDSLCAMSYWGYAYVLGPNYNAGMEPDNFEKAYNAVTKARQLSVNAGQLERELIEALTYRYSNDTTIERAYLDSAYAAAMRKVYQKHADNATIGALFAESLMDLHPWNLWNKDGTMQPWTPEIMKVLEKCLQQDPKHAGANHFYIHATEMSQHAEMALASADLLRDLVPGSGHLVHMPSHTYIRIGRYHDGVVANQNAVKVDSTYMEACHAQGVYPLAYYPHNYHFMSACAVLCGESKAAIEGAMATSNHAHKKLLRDPAWSTLQHYYAFPWYVDVKLGLWKQIKASEKPESDLTYPLVIWNYANGMAALATGDIRSAKLHSATMDTLMQDSSLATLTIWGINNVMDLCLIASHTLAGEISAKAGNYPDAISHLKTAVKMEDALNYDEPPDWVFPIRHHLGAVLIEAGKYKEAVAVYREDLQTFRDNGWALIGLMNAYEKLGDKENYEKSKRRFEAAWKNADIKISTSRIL